jgi:parallel beta-helix repeat protein
MKRIFAVPILILITFALISPIQSQPATKILQTGATLYVGGSGPGNYTTIQTAINASSTGDTIYVYNDSAPYYEYLTIPHTINLIGEDRNSTIVDANNTHDIITINADDTLVRGLTLRNSGDYAPYPAALQDNANYTILTDLSVVSNEDGIVLTGSHHSIISDSVFRGNRVGIRLEKDSTQNRITYNNIVNSFLDYQVAILDSPDNTIDNNSIFNDDQMGIYVNNSPRTILLDNTITGCSTGIVLNSNDSIVSRNTFQNNTEAGLSLNIISNCTITDNAFHHDGINVYRPGNNTVWFNTLNGLPVVYAQGLAGHDIEVDAGQIILINCLRVTVKKQSIHDACTAVQCWGCHDCNITDNNLTNCLSSLILEDCRGTTVADNLISDSRSKIFYHPLEIGSCEDTIVTRNQFWFASDLTDVYIGGCTTLDFTDNIFHTVFDRVYNHLMVGSCRDTTIARNTLESGSIGISQCYGVLIKDNILNRGSIDGEYGFFNRIIDNTITPANGAVGLGFSRMKLGTIRDNTVTDGTGAIFLSYCYRMTVRGNSFVDCGSEPANYTNCFHNTWAHNYWGTALTHPKVIHGTIEFTIGTWPAYRTITIPVFAIDISPKLLP